MGRTGQGYGPDLLFVRSPDEGQWDGAVLQGCKRRFQGVQTYASFALVVELFLIRGGLLIIG